MPTRNKVKQNLTNNNDSSFTAAYDLGGLPLNATSWTWKGKIEDQNKKKYQAQDGITGD